MSRARGRGWAPFPLPPAVTPLWRRCLLCTRAEAVSVAGKRAPPSTRARRPPRGRGPCPGDSGNSRLMAAGSGFVGAEASSGGGWGERADAFLLHVDSSRRVGRGAPLHTGRHLGTGANSCNRQNNCDVYVINCPILYTQAVLISNCKKISFLVLIFSFKATSSASHPKRELETSRTQESGHLSFV